MIYPGTYRAVEQTTVELCRRNEQEATVLEYTTYEPGDEFVIPQGVNGFFRRVMFDREGRKPMGRYERTAAVEAD